MAVSLSLIGMGLIILSWIVQIVFVAKGQKAIRPCFAAMQFLGIALLVADSYLTAGIMTPLAWMNVASALGALVTMALVFRK
jgi:hypothetical protein